MGASAEGDGKGEAQTPGRSTPGGSSSLHPSSEDEAKSGAPSRRDEQERKMRSPSQRCNNKMVVLVCTNIANLSCHAVYSVLSSFYPPQAKAKGMSDDMVGFTFAIFAGIIFVFSPVAGKLMERRGKVWVYLCGLCIASVSTILFAFAALVPDGWPFAAWCLTMRIAQGVGSALEETAMYAIIAELDTENVTFYLGICEVSTGLGYMIGPPLGGFLFHMGGFSMPFVFLGALIAPAAIGFHRFMPHEVNRGAKDEERSESVSLRGLTRNPQVMVMAVAGMIANMDYAFLEPTLGEHAASAGIAESPEAIGALFSVAMTSYTLSCPVIGLIARKDRLGPRTVILVGLFLQLLGFMLIGPSPLLQQSRVGTPQVIFALLLFGVGESMSYAPLMDDMMLSCWEYAEEASVALAPLMASSFSLGQMLGPLVGSASSGA